MFAFLFKKEEAKGFEAIFKKGTSEGANKAWAARGTNNLPDVKGLKTFSKAKPIKGFTPLPVKPIVKLTENMSEAKLVSVIRANLQSKASEAYNRIMSSKKNTVVLWHGTTEKVLDSILEKGLLVSKVGTGVDKVLGQGASVKGVYVANTEAFALAQADELTRVKKIKAIVLRVEIPKKLFIEEFKKDSQSRGMGGYIFKKDIPPQWIKAYRVVSGVGVSNIGEAIPEGKSSFVSTRKEDNEFEAIYITLFTVDSVEKKEGWEGVPRDADGKWTTVAYGGKGIGWKSTGVKLTPSQQDRLIATVIPPGWSNVLFNLDPKAKVYAKGFDVKGNQQSRYNPHTTQENANAKWERVREFHKTAYSPIMKRATEMMNDPTVSQGRRDLGAVVRLMGRTGFRIGGSETTADEQAYGASTLQKRHIKVDEDKITFHFTGKSGVDQNKTITDKPLADYLKTKLPSLKNTDEVFTTSADQSLKFIKETSGNPKFKNKDFRTWNGTGLALAIRKKMPVPKTTKEYQEQRNQIGDAVASHLGNSRTMALNSYIAPYVFDKWPKELAPVKKPKVTKGEVFDLGEDPYQEIWDALEEEKDSPAEGPQVDWREFPDDPPNGPSDENGNLVQSIAKGFSTILKGKAKPMYVSRKLLNADEVIAWAKENGFDKVVQPKDMHTTIAYSREPVDLSPAGDHFDNVQYQVEASPKPLGDKGGVVLPFESKELQKRWKAFRDVGASWDYESYQPHVTISYDAKDVDLSKVKPFKGVLKFGPEIHEPLDTEWSSKIVEKAEAWAGVPRDAEGKWTTSMGLKNLYNDDKAQTGKNTAEVMNHQLGLQYYKLRNKLGNEHNLVKDAYAEWQKSKDILTGTYGYTKSQIGDLSLKQKNKVEAMLENKKQQSKAIEEAGESSTLAEYHAKMAKIHAEEEKKNVVMPKGAVGSKDGIKAAYMMEMKAIAEEGKYSDSAKAASALVKYNLEEGAAQGLTKGQMSALKAHASMAYKGIAFGAKASNPGLKKPVAGLKKPKGFTDIPKGTLDLDDDDFSTILAGYNIASPSKTELRAYSKKTWDSLSDKEKSAVYSHIGSGYKIGNKNFAKGNTKIGDSYIDSALDHPLGMNLKLRRNMPQRWFLESFGMGSEDKYKMTSLSQEKLNEIVGKTYTEKAVSSTTWDLGQDIIFSQQAGKTGKMKLMIRAGPAARGLAITESIGNNESEQEVTLKRGATYVIRSIKKLYNDMNNYNLEVHADLIGHAS